MKLNSSTKELLEVTFLIFLLTSIITTFTIVMTGTPTVLRIAVFCVLNTVLFCAALVVAIGCYTAIQQKIDEYKERKVAKKKKTEGYMRPYSNVTWNSLTPIQKRRALEIFGPTLVNDFSRTKAGTYPLYKALYYCLFYETVNTKGSNMSQAAADRLSLYFVNEILGFNEGCKICGKKDYT